MTVNRSNCWEFMKCGREPGGQSVDELGVCPAAEERMFHATNRGENGGRICWFVAGTFCDGVVQGTFAEKFHDCHDCEFYQYVQHQEERHFTIARMDLQNVDPAL